MPSTNQVNKTNICWMNILVNQLSTMATTCFCISIWLFFWSNMFLKFVRCETWSTIRLIFGDYDLVVFCVGFKLFHSIDGCVCREETLNCMSIYQLQHQQRYILLWMISMDGIALHSFCLLWMPWPLNFLPLIEHWQWSMKTRCPAWGLSANNIPESLFSSCVLW